MNLARGSAAWVTICLLVSGSQSASAQGITNPAGGGAIPIALHLVLGLGLLGYVAVALVAKKITGKAPVLLAMTILILLYCLVGFVEIAISDYQRASLYLYLEMLIILAGMIFLWFRGFGFQILGVVGLTMFVAVANFLRPQLVDFQARVYVDNEKDIDFVEVTYPGHWREMHLADGRVLLNINPFRQVGGSRRMIADANKIKPPISFAREATHDHQVIFDVYKPEATRGTWGWKDRPKAFFEVPLLGTVHIPRFEQRWVAKALLLDENKRVECQYLHEARGEPIPSAQQGGYVTWSTAATVTEGSVVGCEP